MTGVRLELRKELVRQRQPWIDRERSPQRLLGLSLAVPRVLDVFADHAVAASEPRPRGGEVGIELEAALVQLACTRESVVRARQLVGAKVQLVRARAVRGVRRG